MAHVAGRLTGQRISLLLVRSCLQPTQAASSSRQRHLRNRACCLANQSVTGQHLHLLPLQRQGRAGRKFSAMSAAAQNEGYDYDLFVIGGGTGGVRAARISSQLGAKVGLCELPLDWIASDEKGGLGGTCILRGCVPKKLLHYASEFTEELRIGASYGWQVAGDRPPLDWKTLIHRKNQELMRLSSLYEQNLKSAGVEQIEGKGKITGRESVSVNGKTFKVKHILVAVGGLPTKAPIEGSEHAITSDEVLNLPELPKKIVMIGGGYIACEQACIYTKFGAEVHFLIRGPTVLNPAFDEECRLHAGEQYKHEGVKLQLNVSPTKFEKQDNGKLTVRCEPKEGEPYHIHDVDQVLLATGRKPRTQGLGLEEVGVELDPKGGVKVNEFSRSSVESIWAVGDVTNRIPLTPVARMEGTQLARHLFGGKSDAKPDHTDVASVVFSTPAVAVVGVNEQVAIEQFKNVDVYTSTFTPMKSAFLESKPKALVKAIVATDTDKVIGYHMVAPEAAEIIQGLAATLKAGITKKQLDDCVGLHPTSAEEFVTLSSPARRYRDGKLYLNDKS